MWPRGCVLDCQRGRHRPVCGSNGRLYKSLCAFQRAQCINTQLRHVPRGHCTPLCSCPSFNQLKMFFPTAVFVPACGPEGHFMPTQCHNQTGYCWCSTPDGKPVSGTTALHVIPNCTGHTNSLCVDLVVKSSGFMHFSKSSDCSVFISSKCNNNGSISLLTSEKCRYTSTRGYMQTTTCQRERASLLSQTRQAREDERFIPECTADGRYSPVQCHTATGYCWCVRVDTGRPRPGTSARLYSDPTGCPGARKKKFLQSLVRALDSNTDPSSAPSPTSNPPPSVAPSSSSSSLDNASADAAESSRPEVVLQWHFNQLDVDSDGWLSEREARPLRQFLRRRLKPRRCAKKFAQYCDSDRDRSLTLEELRVCLHFLLSNCELKKGKTGVMDGCNFNLHVFAVCKFQ
uniref:SPARC related modular calcium binding 1 n=1 Tax=Haplochromis burtoni TaxID=8153 RepID=A0A3Q2V1R5_HAPBU